MGEAVIRAECGAQPPAAHRGQPSFFTPGAEMARPGSLCLMNQEAHATGCGDLPAGACRQLLRSTHSQSFTEGASLEQHGHVHHKQAAVLLTVPQGDRNFY